MKRIEGEVLRRNKGVINDGICGKLADDSKFAKFVMDSLRRHARGDWGNMSKEDKDENELALREGNLRIFSAYLAEGLLGSEACQLQEIRKR